MVKGHKCFTQGKEGLMSMKTQEEVLKDSKGKEEKEEATLIDSLYLLRMSGLIWKATRVHGLALTFLL